MERIQWVFRPRDSGIRGPEMVAGIEAACEGLDPAALRVKLTATLEPPPRWSVIPFSKTPVALVSLDVRDRKMVESSGARADTLESCTREVFEVETSVPVNLPGAPEVGDWAPGCELLTLFRRKPGLDDETFIQRWHGGHTPLSLEIHPLWGYIRNVVKRRNPAATPLDGIVEEYFRERRDLINPAVFFGGPLRMIPNMVRVAADVNRFIDMKTIETYWVRERWLRAD